MPLREELQQALGTSYTLERELGGGGMSRVFVAEEKSLGRRVVVKVLPPEIADGVVEALLRQRDVASHGMRRNRVIEQGDPLLSLLEQLDHVFRLFDLSRAGVDIGDGCGTCIVCMLTPLAEAYDEMGNADSTIAVLERYLGTSDYRRPGVDATYLAATHKPLGELYEARNEGAKALDHFLKFVDLWKNADPELQPKVAEVRRRISRLSDTERLRP